MLDGREAGAYSLRVTSEPGSRSGFQSTLWSVVLEAREGSESKRRLALERLCGIYWQPLYAYLRRKGHSPEDAQDGIQEFFTYFVERSLIDRADPGRGRFRGYLRGVLDRYLSNAQRKEHALKRGGGRATFSLDFDRAEREGRFEPSHQETPEAAFARGWKLAVLEQAVSALKREYEAEGASMKFAVVCAHLSATASRPSYEELAKQLGCSTTDVTNLLHRARKRLGELLRGALRETVGSDAEVDEEIQALFRP
jgi:RNA polymerase sigma-70 factor (ECF subfamily)